MPRFASFLTPFALTAALSACGSFASPFDGTDQSGAGVTSAATTDSPFESTYPTVFVRGTPNDWAASPMSLVGDHDWSLELASGPTDSERFKFDVYGDWSVNFGDDEGDQLADPSGHDIALPPGKRLIVHFNDASSYYWVEERTWQAEVAIRLPGGIDRRALDRKQVNLSIDGQPYGWSYIYVDDEHPTAYAPIGGLALGAEASLTFDSIIGNRRLVGNATWTVDGDADPIAVQMQLEEASLADHGAVHLEVVSDRWESGAMVSSPYGSVSVFLGDWHAGNMLGQTGDDGKLSLMVPAGEQTLSAMLMTSSHSMASASTTLTVQAGEFVGRRLHMAPLEVLVHAHCDAGWGNAVYITGASEYLGDWKQATRMDYDSSRGAWVFHRNLPVGLPFKLVLAPWSDGAVISTNGVKWEKGSNRTVTPPQGYYMSEIAAYPAF